AELNFGGSRPRYDRPGRRAAVPGLGSRPLPRNPGLASFRPRPEASVVQDIVRRLDGRLGDLYVMTREHMDHVKGLLRAHSAKQRLPAIEYAWLTGSAHPRYGQRFPEAQKKIELYQAAYERVRLAATQRGLLGLTSVRAFMGLEHLSK